MKRDMDLMKLLLREVEGEEPKPDLSGYSEEQTLYHYELMEEAGLVVAGFVRSGSGEVVSARIVRLTNLGPMPFRNSGINLADGILGRARAVSVFAQAWPTAHRLAQRPRTGPRPALWNSHLGNLPESAAHHQTHLCRA